MSRTELVLLTGWACPGEVLTEVVTALGSQVRSTILGLPDMTGSPSPAPAAALAEQLERRATPVVLGGWSTGALVALETALRLPSLVRGLVLLSGTACFCCRDDYAAGTPDANVRALQRGLRRTPAPTLESFFRDAAAPQTLASDVLQGLVAGALRLDLDQLRAGLDYLRGADVRSRLAEIQAPALLIHGAVDRIVPVAAGESLARGLCGAKLVNLPQAGHLLPYFNADAVAGHMRAFVQDCG